MQQHWRYKKKPEKISEPLLCDYAWSTTLRMAFNVMTVGKVIFAEADSVQWKYIDELSPTNQMQ